MTQEPGFTDAKLVACMPRLYAFAVKLTRQEDRAKDLLQDTLLRMHRFKLQFVEGDDIFAWGCTIMRRYHLTQIRRDNRMRTYDEVAYQHLPIPAADQAAAYEARTTMERVWNARFLTPLMKQAVMLVCYDGLSYQEAADVMGVAVGTIKSRVNRAREVMLEYA